MKTHYFTSDFFINPNGTVWFQSACKLTASPRPTKQRDSTYKKTHRLTCQRCYNVLKKNKINKVIENAKDFTIYKGDSND